MVVLWRVPAGAAPVFAFCASAAEAGSAITRVVLKNRFLNMAENLSEKLTAEIHNWKTQDGAQHAL